MSSESSLEREKWQAKLEKDFVPKGLDAALIAAISSEEGQTYEGSYHVLQAIAGSSSDEVSSVNEDSQRTSSDIEKTSEQADSSSSIDDAKEQEERVEQLLQEWKLVDVESNLADNLQLTDEEDFSKEHQEGEDDIHVREAKRLGEASSTGLLDAGQVAAGKEGVTSATRESAIFNDEDGSSGLAFLMHAFPSRTPLFLEEMLQDEQGSVEQVIDTLTVMEMVENGDLDENYLDARLQSREEERGLNYGLLEKGTRNKKTSKNERRRRKEQASSASAMSGMSKGAPQKINLTDIRQGGPSVMHLPRKAQPAKKETNDEPEDDAAMAARLDAEERKAAGLPSAQEEDTVQDNDWLFSNSILDQLSDLLDLPSHKVRSIHNTCHFNLRATTQRLITLNCQEWPTLASLDKAGNAPEGTALTIVDGLTVLLPYKARSEVERAFRGTKGRQDATIDLIQLVDVVEKSAIGEKTDILDPMKASRSSKEVAVPTETKTQTASNRQGHFDFVGQDPPPMTPGNLPYSVNLPYSHITKRSLQAGGKQSASRKYAMEALKAGAASTSFPLNSAHMDSINNNNNNSSIPARSSLFEGVKRHETQSEAERLASEYRTIANEYRARREQSLMQAASAYRSLPGGGASKQVRGAAAWVYADEARRLDAKARAFSLKAAQATVRHRMMMTSQNYSSASTSATTHQRRSPDVVDLHGLTVHESLSITKEALSAWWSRSSSGNVHPLYIVTGVGRHSKGQVAVIRPAILKMLNRDGWIVDERREGQITVKGLR